MFEIVHTDRPVIGIVCKYISESPNPHNTSCMIRQEILQAIIDHDALPACVTLPRLERPKIHANHFGNLTSLEQEILREQIHRCDGLIFQGGQHIEDFEYEAALYAHIKYIPALGFCSGQTVMARIDTIKLVDVDPCVHNVPHQELVHSVKVVPDTLFHRIVGTYELVVNSRHSKAIAACSNLKISARDRDGNAEVIEDPRRNFYLATRFHPESLYQTEPLMDKIIQAFINAADRYSTSRKSGLSSKVKSTGTI